MNKIVSKLKNTNKSNFFNLSNVKKEEDQLGTDKTKPDTDGVI